MSDNLTIKAAGRFELTAFRKVGFGSAFVALRTGGSATVEIGLHMTPAECRAFAKALVTAAEHAEVVEEAREPITIAAE
jgi:hypothetical protein